MDGLGKRPRSVVRRMPPKPAEYVVSFFPTYGMPRTLLLLSYITLFILYQMQKLYCQQARLSEFALVTLGAFVC